MTHLSLSLLGTFEATIDGVPVTAFGSDKARALLAFLAVESARPHRRAELAGMLWPDLAEKRAAHNLSQTLFRLRRALGEVDEGTTSEPFLLPTPQDIQFNPRSDHRLDVASFAELVRAAREHHPGQAEMCNLCLWWLQQAADLYRGDLLAGFFLGGSVGFEEWQLVQQEVLHRQAVETLSRLVAHHEAQGEPGPVGRYAGQLLALEPWHEQGLLSLMHSLVATGQAAAALDRYQVYCRALEDEFGLGPPAEAVTLLKQIRSGQMSGAPLLRGAAGGSTTVQQSVRRQVTAFVCSQRDPVGESDPEELHERLVRCRAACNAVMERWGGYYMSGHDDGCVVYFGYPRAREDAAICAVHAGLALVTELCEMVQARVGIHTGPVVVSPGQGDGTHATRLVGNVAGVARACQDLAKPSTLLITGYTERLLQGRFDCRRLGTWALPGQADPVELYQVVGESKVRTRLDWVAETRGMTGFTGRGPELERLLAAAGEAMRGGGQVVVIDGDSGIGKSRLVRELRTRLFERHGDGMPVWVESACSPYFQNTSLYPIVGLLEQLLEFAAGDSPDARRARLNQVLADHDVTHPSAGWLLSLLLGLPAQAPTPATLTADQRERMRARLIVLLQRQAARQPLVLVIEDLHWSDPTTVEWLGRSFDALATTSCLVLLTHRPTFTPSWLPRSHVHSLALGPLSPDETERMVSNVAREDLLSAEMRREILGRADGNPLFVEELTRTTLDLHTSQSATLPATVKIPETLRDSLAARLDRAGTASETARWAAVVGREFAYPLLRAVVPFNKDRLENDLAVLAEHDLLRTLSPQASWAFKHALIRDAAYDSLLTQARRDHHRHVAETLESGFPDMAETRPEVVAQHYAGAGEQARAADFFLRAGQRATAQGATQEAITFFDRAIECIEPGDVGRHWQALCGRETAMLFRGDKEAQRADVEALLDLAQATGDETYRAQALIRQARYAGTQADYPTQRDAAGAAIVAARRAGALTAEVEALAYEVTALLRLGDTQAAHDVVAQTMDRAKEAQDNAVRAYAHAAVALYYVEEGDPAHAVQFLNQSLAAARQAAGRSLDLESQYLGHLGVAYCHLGLYAEARAAMEEGLDLANLMGIDRFQAYHLLNLGYVYMQMHDLDAALGTIEQALARFTATGDVYGQAGCQTYRGNVLQMMGNHARAAKHLADACDAYAEIGVEVDRIEALADATRVALALEQPEEAQRMALEVWHFLCDEDTEGLGPSANTYLCVADVMAALATPDVSPRNVLEAGYRDLMARAAKISDPVWRRSFLHNIEENRELVTRWEEMNRSE